MSEKRLTRGDRLSMGLRAALLQATWNYERQQGLGWAWALKPALDRFYPDAERRRERLTEHTAYFNTQPTLASLALGAVAGGVVDGLWLRHAASAAPAPTATAPKPAILSRFRREVVFAVPRSTEPKGASVSFISLSS